MGKEAAAESTSVVQSDTEDAPSATQPAEPAPSPEALLYVGEGAFLNGVPATFLEPSVIAELAGSQRKPIEPEAFRASLIASGLYKAQEE